MPALESLYYTPIVWAWVSLQAGKYIHALGGDVPQLHEDRSSCAQGPPRPHPIYFFIWQFICTLYYIL